MIAELKPLTYDLRTDMSRFDDLPKAYDASAVEDAISKTWEESGAYKPQGTGEPYSIVMPPPNRTGTLHMGHATMLAIEDLLIRFHRMQGKRAWWIPGTDHAAIATQVKVEQLLMKQGMKNPREELGREKFLEEVVKFAEESATTIRTQVRKMGSSCDWSAEKYTLDEQRNAAVNEMFKMMYDDGIIERGYRIVNWDPQFQTTLSDDEVQTKETTAKLLTFQYDKDFPIAISTTRPETKFGDTAVAVHPEDKRYAKLVGQTFTPTFCGKKLTIKIIADEAVDPEFGTGALGVTPAHSMIDAEMAVRHGLETIPVIGKDGRMIAGLVGEGFGGMTIEETRKKVQEQLEASGLLESVADVAQNLPIAERGGAPVEQLPMEQWFIRVNKPFALRNDTLGKWKKGEKTTLKELMRHAVESGQTKIVPERFDKTYFHWIDNLRDWCISRQIWFGHRIPVWYRGEEMQVSATSPGSDWTQDPDTLDTWFSSGLWTFSTLGWPDKDTWEKNKAFHPTAVLETGYDILFFWVARMILMSTYAIGEVPFKHVYLHGLVRDEQGRKMSKSLGNILDPLDLIPKYGTDAVRLSLVLGSTPGQDVKLSEEKIQGFRNFTNKLWNISRFVLPQIKEGSSKSFNLVESKIDLWILIQLRDLISSVTEKIGKYEFSLAGDDLRQFTWSQFADTYLEYSKTSQNSRLLEFVLRALIRMWHPFMPFVTEYVWSLFNDKLLISGKWLQEDLSILDIEIDKGLKRFNSNEAVLVHEISNLLMFIKSILFTRADHALKPSEIRSIVTNIKSTDFVKTIQDNIEFIRKQARVQEIKFVDQVDSSLSGVLFQGLGMVALEIDANDISQERIKLAASFQETQIYSSLLRTKLENQEFISKAPAKVKEEMERKYGEVEAKLKALKERLEKLG